MLPEVVGVLLGLLTDARYEPSTVKHGLVIFRAGSIGGRFLFTYRPYEEGLLVLK